jgi:hypothetical protein
VISLSDSELSIVMSAAAPLHPSQRHEFLQDVVAELQRYEVLGPGIIGRVVRDVQRQHMQPKRSHNVGSKYGH